MDAAADCSLPFHTPIARSAASIQKEETAFKSSLSLLHSELASLWDVPEDGTPKSEDRPAPLQGWELQVRQSSIQE